VKSRREFLAAATAGTMSFASMNAVASGQVDRDISCAIAGIDTKREYGLATGLIYLNSGSSGPTPSKVLERTMAAWLELEKNPVANMYGLNGVLGLAEKARQNAASFLGCAKEELLLTRSTSESMNVVAQSIKLREGDRVLITDQEHEGGSDCWLYLSRRHGIVVDKVTIPYGVSDPHEIVQRIADGIRPSTRVISYSHILFATGLRMPVAEISALARSRNMLCIVDGAQAAGSTPIDVKKLGCHAYATTGHKWLLGPKGVGMLYISSDASDEIKPIQWTGGKMYVDNSTGAGPLPLVVGLGAAIEAAHARGVANIEIHNMRLRGRLYRGLAQISGVNVMSPPSGKLATALISFALPASVDNLAVYQRLIDKHSIVVRVIDKQYFNGLRISPHIFNTESDIDALLKALKPELA
jgi:selenocysteine lyase/cysteine desulfurase